MPQIFHKDWDINEQATGRVKDGKHVMAATIQKGLNDIEPNGSFVPCDLRISEVTQGVTHLKMNRGRMGELRFGDSSHPNSFLVKIKDKGLKGVSFKYTGASGESMTANNGKPLCHFDNGISIESTPTYNGVKMDIIVNDPLTAPLEYPFSVKTYGQDYSFIEENGGATLRGEDQHPIFIKPPYAEDANGDIGPVTIHYTGMDGNLITFKKVVDDAWLRQAAAPVRIDPDVTIVDGVDGGVIEDTMMIGGDDNYGAFPEGHIGANRSSLIKVDLTEYSGVSVSFAKFGLDIHNVPASINISWYQVLVSWVEGTETGSPEVGSTSAVSRMYDPVTPVLWHTPYCKGAGEDRAISAEGSKVITSIDSDSPFVVSPDVVQDWIDNPSSSHGIVLERSAGSSSASRFRSSEATLGNKPYFYMEFTEAVAGGGQIINGGIIGV